MGIADHLFLSPINTTNPIFWFWKPSFYILIAFLKVLIIKRFGFFNQWKNNINLSSLSDLMADKIHYLRPLVFETMNRRDWLPSGRQFIHHTVIKVAICGHRKCAGYRGGGHHQYMRRNCCFTPQPGPLGYAKTMLFVHDGQSQLLKLDRFLQHRM